MPASTDQVLEIIGRPKIYKINCQIFHKYLDLNIRVTRKRVQKTNAIIKNTHYIDMLKLSQELDKGKYLLKVRINLYPYYLKRKFEIPLSKYIKP